MSMNIEQRRNNLWERNKVEIQFEEPLFLTYVVT